MPQIIWKGIIESENDFPASEIPQNAVKIDAEEDIKKMQLKALPFLVPSVLLCLICMFAKTFMAGEKVVNIFFLFAGVIIGLVLIIAHEFLHAAAFPKNATVYIGIMPKCLSAVALSSCPVKRNRFVFLSLLPVILGIIPLILFCAADNGLKELNGLMFGMAVMGMVSVYPDFYNVFHILKTVPPNAYIQNNKNESYYYE